MVIWIVLGSILLVLLLLLQLSIVLDLRWGTDTRVRVGIAGLYYTIHPKPQGKSGDGSGKGSEGKGAGGLIAKIKHMLADMKVLVRRGKDQSFGEFIQSIFELLEPFFKPVKGLLQSIRIEGLSYQMTVGSPDAHRTALLYAGLSTGFYQVLAVLQTNLKVQCKRVVIQPDFTSEKIVMQGQMKLKLRLGTLLWRLLLMTGQIAKTISKRSANRAKASQSKTPQPVTK